MQKFTLLLAVFVVAVLQPLSSLGQVQTPSLSKIDSRKPTVYLGFDSRVKSFDDCSLKEGEAFRLKLQNNSSAPINVAAGYAADGPLIDIKGMSGRKHKGLPVGSVIRMCYQPELVGSSRTSVPGIDEECTCDWQQSFDRQNAYEGLWIQSGGHVLFDVPVRYLESGLRVYTVFRYEWEMQNLDLSFEEPRHQVFIYSSDIPRKIP